MSDLELKEKKKKSCISTVFTESEKEVQFLIDNSSLTIDLSSNHYLDNESFSVNFFCGTSEENTSRNKTDRTDKNASILDSATLVKRFDAIEENPSSINHGSSDELADFETELNTGQPTTASSFLQIQIEDIEDISHRLVSNKFIINGDLLFKPHSRFDFSARRFDLILQAKSLSPCTMQMLERFTEQYKYTDKKFKDEILNAIKNVVQEKHFLKCSNLYRSFTPFRFHPTRCLPSREVFSPTYRKLIKIFFKEVRLTAHPGLSAEHKIANRLEGLYEEYEERIRDSRNEKVYKLLQEERGIVNSLLNRAEQQRDFEDCQVFSLEQHSLRVKQLRNQLYDLEAQNKLLLNQLLETWVELKAKREFQGNQYTRIKLNLHIKEPISDIPEELSKWKERFETDLHEIYREELEVFYNASRVWKEKVKKSGTSSERPKKPEIPKLSADLTAKYKKCFFSPEEPRIFITKHYLDYEEYYKVYKSDRRSSKVFFLELYFDGQYVGATRNYRMEPDFCLYLNELIGIFVDRTLPTIITIKICEKLKLQRRRKLATIRVPVTSPTQFFNGQVKSFKFCSEKPLHIEGLLSLTFQCETDVPSPELSALSLPSPQDQCEDRDSRHDRRSSEAFEMQNLEERTIKSNESNENEGESTPSRSLKSSARQYGKTCTLEENLLQFAPKESFENSVRLQLLRSRYLKNNMRTKGLRMIPALDHEVDFNLSEEDEDVLEVGNWMQAIDLQKYRAKKFLKRLYETLKMQCDSLSSNDDCYENILIGDEASTWRGFFQAISSLFTMPRGSLYASQTNESLNRAALLDFNSKQAFKVIVNVVRGTGVPVRDQRRSPNRSLDDSPTNESPDNSSFLAKNIKFSNVRPFVVVGYQDKCCRTMTADGSDPIWNTNLELQLSGCLSDLREDLKIVLFDEVVEQQWSQELSIRSSESYHRTQSYYLGEYRIPIRVLLKNKKLGGVFELSIPKILIGYKSPSFHSVLTIEETIQNIKQYPEIKDSIYLWLYISMEPCYELPSINVNCLSCSELKEVRASLERWETNVNIQKPERFVQPKVCTMDGKLVCLTRMLEPIPLPFEASPNLFDSAARYVSLINTLKQYDPCSELNGIWLNNKSILELSWCSQKDLAVLLCNFLLALDLTAYLALGFANSLGDCAFVLFKDSNGQLKLIDPTTGKLYSTRDIFCPLQSVHCIVSKENIYCNIQSEKRVLMTNFNLQESSCWMPAFPKRFDTPTGGVHRLDFSLTTTASFDGLAKSVERKIMKKINSWRSMRKTIWNRAFQPKMLLLLQNMEESVTFESDVSRDYLLIDRLTSEFPTFKIFGFTLNFSYTNLSSISERVKTTAIHTNADENVQFSLAVHIEPYPNNILSVWVFIISAISTRIS